MRIPLTLPAGRSRDVLAVGENSIDLLAELDGHPAPDTKMALVGFTERPGGQSATAAVAMARLGLRTSYIGRIGDDDYGRRGLDSLVAEGIDVAGVVTIPGVTSRFAVILVDRRSGTRTVLWHRDPALLMAPADIPARAVGAARVLYVDGSEVAAATAATEDARRCGTRTVIDIEKAQPGTDRLLRSIDVIIAAEAFPADMTSASSIGLALARMQDETGAAVVCVTLGEQGSLARVGGREIRTPAYPVSVVDSTGAGDVFRAGFLAAWLHGGDATEVEDALRWANATAALKCRGLGARTTTPTLAELRAFLDGRL